MRAIFTGLFLLTAILVSGCTAAKDPKFLSYDGPEVTQIFVAKERRKMYLLNGTDVVASYVVDLGFQPSGHKAQSGDGRTPEGLYLIDRRNPNSAYHLSIGISYPNRADIAAAKALGVEPGGDIFIHGASRNKADGRDWTAGCIAVTDAEMEQIYAMVKDGTPIYIRP
jgi:murein L,D-transpeptidase YafK